MIAKKRVLPILVAMLMVFAMMPMTAGTAYAIDIDTTPPEIDADSIEVTLPEGKETVTTGDKVRFAVSLSDNVGVTGANIVLRNREGNTDTGRDFHYNSERGKWELEFEITDRILNGRWSITRISASDGNNTTDLWNSDVLGNTPNKDLSAFDFVVEGTNVDTTPPEIDADSIEVSLPEGKDEVVAGDKVRFAVSLSDNVGVTGANIVLRNREGNTDTGRDFHYNSESGKWELEFKIEENTNLGKWSITRISASDGNNTTDLWNSDVLGNTPNADLSAFDFMVVKCYRIAFDTRGGNIIDPQYVISGDKAVRPDDPTKGGGAWQGGGDFVDWYADEALAQKFNFNTPITEDTTVYAKWAYGFSISSYDKTNSVDYAGGQYMVLQHGATEDYLFYGGSNYTLYEGDAITLKAYPDKGYQFSGWYKGEYIGMVDDEHTQVSRPLDMSDPDNLLSTNPEYSFTVEQCTVVCPVFEVCTDHEWDAGTVSKHATCKEPGTKVFKCTVCGTEKTEEIAIDPNAHVCQEKVQKATPTADGRIYQTCSACGEEETVAPLLKVSKISLAGTSYTYTGKAITPKVTVANTGETLSADNYTVTYSGNTNVGTATAKVTLKGKYYEGSKSLTFKITKAANPLKISAKTATVKYSKLKKKAQTLAVTKVIKFTKKLNDKKTYTLVSAKKGSKNFKKYFKINKTTGKVTIKKNSKMKKGIYKVKVKVKAAGNANYKPSAVKTVTFTVKVK